MFHLSTSSPETFEICLLPMKIAKTCMAVISYGFCLMDDLRERLYVANVEEVYAADLFIVHNKFFCATGCPAL